MWNTQRIGQPASQKTEIRIGYDDSFIYVGMTCWENEKKGFATTAGAAGRPWWDDGVECSLAPPSWGGWFLHQIVSAGGGTYQHAITGEQDKERNTAIPVGAKARTYPDRFTVEIAIPLGSARLPAPKPGQRWKAQFMRTRVLPSAAREHSAWNPTESFHDYTRFGTAVFE